MATLQSALTSIEAVADELNLKDTIFDSSGSGNRKQRKVQRAIRRATAYVQGRIGDDYPGTAGTDKRSIIEEAELLLACAYAAESLELERIHAREDPYPEEYIDHGRSAEIIANWRAEVDELIAPFVDSADTLADQPGSAGFSIGGVGIDETYNDDYDIIDFGEEEVG